MTNLDYLKQCGEELSRRLCLKTFPLAVKLLEREEDIPEAAMRPLRDLGYHLELSLALNVHRSLLNNL